MFWAHPLRACGAEGSGFTRFRYAPFPPAAGTLRAAPIPCAAHSGLCSLHPSPGTGSSLRRAHPPQQSRCIEAVNSRRSRGVLREESAGARPRPPPPPHNPPLGQLYERPGQLSERSGQLSEQPGQLYERPGHLYEQRGHPSERPGHPSERWVVGA
jgi:hypothetical protein